MKLQSVHTHKDKDENNWFEWPHKRVKIRKDYTGWDFRMWPSVELMGWPQ